ncbi:hypothetical protein L6164_026642 [Bauhinia variegata]|uniref:Uncharacterized protein n=1 Tax=Bauhinia variegata TaxID=167791 RepID=A0ACB9LRF2_BAUVA|nr:hypothetical protein L6164_026642 [Bauhinia variegata]
MLHGFPQSITVSDVKVFIEQHTGEGTVYAIRVRLENGQVTRVFAVIQFTTNQEVSHIIFLASESLYYGSSSLKARELEKDIKKAKKLSGWLREYKTVFWLITPYGEVPGFYPDSDSALSFVVQEVHEYFTNYIVNDSLGIISNAHTAFADKEKLKAMAKPCLELAKLFSIAVHFPKTGVLAVIPPELHVKEFPDFMGKLDKPTYQSWRIIGMLFRLGTGLVLGVMQRLLLGTMLLIIQVTRDNTMKVQSEVVFELTTL